jgi:predicted DCC family thiol-disulfide oxidoreductase YuxK
MSTQVQHLVLYDGVCGLCNRLNQFILKRDRLDRFRFAALQSSVAGDLLRRYQRNPDDLDTVYVVADYGQPTERVLWKGRAVVFVLKALGGLWSWARILDFLPTAVLDVLYEFVAKHRYRWFGRSEQCMLPEPRHRSKFIDPG